MRKKGHGVERVVRIPSAAERDVNSTLQAIGTEVIETCQQRVDTKAFTGRGSRHELRQLQDEIDTLDRRMSELSAASKSVAGAQIYLMVHRRHRTGYVFLRWRIAGGSKRHLSWESGQAVFQRYQEPLRAWYFKLAQQAMQTNALHQQARKRMRAMTDKTMRQGQVYARPLPS